MHSTCFADEFLQQKPTALCNQFTHASISVKTTSSAADDIGGVNLLLKGTTAVLFPLFVFIALFSQQELKQSTDQRRTPLTISHKLSFKHTLFQLPLQSL